MSSQKMELTRGDTWDITWAATDSDAAPIDITGARLDWHMRARIDGELIAGASTETGEIAVADPATGSAVITVPYAVTEDIAPGTYISDMQVTFGDGRRKTYGQWRIEVVGDATLT